MGFASSGAAAVLFVGLLVGASVLLPTLQETRERTTEAQEEKHERLLDRRNSDVSTVAVEYNATTDRLTVEVENTGSTTLTVADVDVLVDGVYRSDADLDVGGEAGRRLWHPGERLTATVPTATRPDRVKVVTGTGIALTETGI
jgi:flagellar protein FlaF